MTSLLGKDKHGIKEDIAAEKKASLKYNCAQTVLTTYGDLTGLNEATAMSIADGFAESRNHAAQCRLLKGVDSHVVLRPCPLCVSDVCEFLEEAMNYKRREITAWRCLA